MLHDDRLHVAELAHVLALREIAQVHADGDQRVVHAREIALFECGAGAPTGSPNRTAPSRRDSARRAPRIVRVVFDEGLVAGDGLGILFPGGSSRPPYEAPRGVRTGCTRNYAAPRSVISSMPSPQLPLFHRRPSRARTRAWRFHYSRARFPRLGRARRKPGGGVQASGSQARTRPRGGGAGSSGGIGRRNEWKGGHEGEISTRVLPAREPDRKQRLEAPSGDEGWRSGGYRVKMGRPEVPMTEKVL